MRLRPPQRLTTWVISSSSALLNDFPLNPTCGISMRKLPTVVAQANSSATCTKCPAENKRLALNGSTSRSLRAKVLYVTRHAVPLEILRAARPEKHAKCMTEQSKPGGQKEPHPNLFLRSQPVLVTAQRHGVAVVRQQVGEQGAPARA